MKIGNEGAPSPLSIYRQQSEQVAQANEQGAVKAQKPEAPKGDQVQLSDNAKMMAQAHGVASETPDVRAEKVSALREQVQNGTYQVDNKKVAEGIIKEDMGLFGL